MDVVIFDFEVFRYDTLLGTISIDENGDINLKQMWDRDESIDFYNSHKDYIWIGHNNDEYDNHILKTLLLGGDCYKKSKEIINSTFRAKCPLEIMTYDLMCCKYYSLKMTELVVGKAMHTSEVDFNLNRPLTEQEKKLTEDYNEDDLSQTFSNLTELIDPLILRLDLLREFNLDHKYLTATEATLASLALKAENIEGIENWYLAPKMYDTLQIKNQEVIDFYLREGFRKNEKLTVVLCGVPHNLGSGGIHAAIKRCHETDLLYFDVSGYYNLVMLNYDLLPRTIPQEGKALYEYMYHEQLKLKADKTPGGMAKRRVYKTILLAVFGASMNQYTKFYDPQKGSLITITGQLFLVDLLEKLEGKIKLIQSNTDGIITKVLPCSSEEEVLGIVKAWCERTGFVIKPKHIKEIWQRDVNCYVYLTDDGGYDYRGDLFSGHWSIQSPVKNEMYSDKEAAIISEGVIQYILHHQLPEETVKQHKDNLLFFQYLCRKNTFQYCTYEETDVEGKTTSSRVGDLNRVFASNSSTHGMIYKNKIKDGQLTKAKIANLPKNVFIDNGDILNAERVDQLMLKIDYQYYVNRIYERIPEILAIPEIKKIV